MSVYRNDEDLGVSSEDIDQIKSNGISKTRTTSPEASSTTSDSPTPTNSVHEKNWSSHWQSLVCEEQRQLLGTEEESSDRQSDGEVEGEVWEITPEQREYYKAQFCSLQPDSHGLLPGHIARAFFEKSRLPVAELRKIWQLSDVSKDGALSLEEFNTAMHLVVLRRNQIPVPDILPPPLIPTNQASPHRGKQDPKILHPVALRLTPGPDVEEGSPISEIRPIQRPQPKKHTAPGPGAIPPPPLQSLPDESILSNKKEPPPPPPPRPYRHHTRSSSLDLTRLGKASLLNMPPTVPPRISPGTVSPRKQTEKATSESEVGFANFAQFTEDQKKQQVSAGAFQVYRKPASDNSEPANWSPAEIPLDVKIEVREAHNAVLRKHCHELQLSLAHLREERTALQTILDQLVSH